MTKKAVPNSKPETNKVAKKQIVEAIADKTGLTKRQSEDAYETMLDTMISSLQTGKSVGLAGLGTLNVKATSARTGVKPGTSEKIQIPAGRKVSFKVAAALKENL